MSERAQVHIVDDDASLRLAVSRLLKAAGYDVRCHASSGEFLLNRPDGRHGCLLLDVRMPGPSGLDLHEALPVLGISLPVIFMTGHADVPSCVRAMKAGAVDFLEKPVGAEALLDAVRRALTLGLRKRVASGEENRLGVLFASLTPREREVFERVVAGKLNKQIADELGIAERTVKAQRAHVMEKLGVGSAAELGRIAERILQCRDETAARGADALP